LPRICDYEGSHYRTEFWEGHNRRYEDGVERVAIQNLLPRHGQRLIEIGAGFGRLADLYAGYRQVVLVDYARTQLEEAQRYLGQQNKFIYVVADIYQLPFVDSFFDTLTMVRVMHHLADVPTALREVQRILAPEGNALIEYASKFHLKALARWVLRQQNWNPFDRAPLEFVELNFDFHPTWMRQQFAAAALSIQETRTLSHYRLDFLKRHIPLAWLIKLDSWAQPTGNWWQLAPSVLLKAKAIKPICSFPTGIFCCPTCRSTKFYLTERPTIADQLFICHDCQQGWAFRDGIYDFKTAIALH